MSTSAAEHSGPPQRPEVGPQAQYSVEGHNIGMGPTRNFINVVDSGVDGDIRHTLGPETVLRHIERFDEPSRFMVLVATAWSFGLPFDVVLGGPL